MIDFNIDEIGSDFGHYYPISDNITIFLAKIIHFFHENNGTTEELLYAQVNDTLNHEYIHAAIEDCLEEELEDDHYIFKKIAPI